MIYIAEISFEGRDFGSAVFKTESEAREYLNLVRSEQPDSACYFGLHSFLTVTGAENYLSADIFEHLRFDTSEVA